MPRIDVQPRDLETVLRILQKHLPNREVRAFGSRVSGKAKPFSDLDLVVMGDTPVQASVLMDLADDLDESDLPFKVDIVDWATTGESFRSVIEGQATFTLR